MGTGLRALHRSGWFMRRGLGARGTQVRCAASWLLAAQGVPQVAAPGRERAVIVCKTVGSGALHSMRCCHSTNRAPSSHKSVSDSGSEMGVTVSAQVRSDAVSMSACSFLTSAARGEPLDRRRPEGC